MVKQYRKVIFVVAVTKYKDKLFDKSLVAAF